MALFSRGRRYAQMANPGKGCRDLHWLLRLSGQGLAVVVYVLLGTGLAEVALASPTRVAQRPDLSAQKPTLTTQQMVEEGDKLLLEGKKLFEQNTQESLRKTIPILEKAQRLYMAGGEPVRAAISITILGKMYNELGEKQQALKTYKQALVELRDKSVRARFPLSSRVGEAVTFEKLGEFYDDLGNRQQALEYYYRVLKIFRDKDIRAALPPQESRRNEAKMLITIGLIFSDSGEKQQALNYYNQALEIYKDKTFREVFTKESSKGEAVTLNNIGGIYDDLGEKQQALNYYKQVLSLFQAVEDRRIEALTFSNMGSVYNDLGEKQQALNYYNQALEIYRDKNFRKAFPRESSEGESRILTQVGRIYDDLGEKQVALEHHNQALLMLKTFGLKTSKDRDRKSSILNNIGRVYADLGETQKASKYYHQALELSNDKAARATMLNNIGLAYADLGKKQQALEYYKKALPLRRAVGNRLGEAITLNSIGMIFNDSGKHKQALENYHEALQLFRRVRDRRGEAVVLNNVAYTYRDKGQKTEALTQINAAISIIEDLRTKIGDKDLRTSYFATVQGYYQFKIDLLMQLHKQQPRKGYDIQAAATSDRARARSLIELLTEAKADFSQGIDNPDLRKLVQQERDLEYQREAQYNLLRTAQGDRHEAIQKTIRELDAKLDSIKRQIRETNSAYAKIRYPEPLTLKQIQEQVLDNDTVLLQYSLGEERSYLWVMPKTGELKSYTLRQRQEIETAADEFLATLSGPDGQLSKVAEKGKRLNELIRLDQVTAQFPGKRLLIIADGALYYIPFAALPHPQTQGYQPLIVNHEIVNAPSASTIAFLKDQFGGRKAAAKTLAVLADPVFGNDDPRLTQ